LQSQINKLQASYEIQQSASNNLKSLLQATENELSGVRDAAENTLNIVAKNEVLEVRVDELTENNLMLDEENANLKDTNDMDWFIRGAGVSLIAFLLGMLVTRIRWRKRDSWGS
jgi:SH3 domain protein